MESEFRQLWLQMPWGHDRQVDVQTELLGLIRSCDADHKNVAHTKLSHVSVEYLSDRLVWTSYPTLQIIRLLPAALCANIAARAVEQLIERLQKTPTNTSVAVQLVTLLVHVEWPDADVQKLRRLAFPVLDSFIEQCNDDGDQLQHFWLSLLSQPNSLLLLDYVQHLQSVRRGTRAWRQRVFSLAHVFIQAAANQWHFLADIFSAEPEDDCEISGLPTNADHLRATVRVVRMLDVMQSAPIDEQAAERLVRAKELFTNGGLQHTLLYELERLCTLQRLLYYHVPNLDIGTLAAQFSVLDYLARNLSLNTYDYERARTVLTANDRANAIIAPLPALDDSIGVELDIYEQFTAIRRLFEAIVNRCHDVMLQNNNVVQCKKALRNIVATNTFVDAVEQCITLLFLRWDHVMHVDDLDRTIESGSESCATPPTAPMVSDEAAAQLYRLQKQHSLRGGVGNHRQRPSRRYEKYGFICGTDCLATVLRMLRTAVAQRMHKEDNSDTVAQSDRLRAVTAVITDGLWRLSLFRSAATMSEVPMTQDDRIERPPAVGTNATFVIDVKRFLCEHQPPIAQRRRRSSSSSDEQKNTAQNTDRMPKANVNATDKKCRRIIAGTNYDKQSTAHPAERMNNTLPRRKPRKQRPFGKIADGERSLSFSHSTENERRASGGAANTAGVRNKHWDENGGSDGGGGELVPNSLDIHSVLGGVCVISKMLGSVEHLMAVCMNRGDLKSTRQMIQKHSLENSPLAAELIFTEAFNQTKEKLRQIFVRLQRQEQQRSIDALASSGGPGRSQSPASTIDRIKRAAEIGLDVSSITNIIARFATCTPVHLTDVAETHRIFGKFADKLPFLGLYQTGESLQATIVCDLLLSLANDVDIASNVYEVLLKLWPNIRDVGQRTRIGYFSFLHNAVDAMRQHTQHQHHPIGMQAMLSNDFFVIDQTELNEWLNREQSFDKLRALTTSDADNLEQLFALQNAYKLLRIPKRNSDQRSNSAAVTEVIVQFFERVNDFVHNSSCLLKLAAYPDRTPTELLQIDMYETIGTMVLDQKCTTSELEPLVCGMNMNLAHVIALNLGPIVINVQQQVADIASVEHFIGSFESLATGDCDRLLSESHRNRIGITDEIWSYLSKHNAMLATLLRRLTGDRIAGDVINEIDRFADLAQIDDVGPLHGHNKWMSAVFYDFMTLTDVCVIAQRTGDHAVALKVLHSIKSLQRSAIVGTFQRLQDCLIRCFLRQPVHALSNNTPYAFINCISNINQRAECLLQYIRRINDAQLVLRLIRACLRHDQETHLEEAHRKELQLWLRNITVYARCTELLTANEQTNGINTIYTWVQVKQLSESRPDRILEALLNSDEFALCLQWSAIHSIARVPAVSETLSDVVETFVRTVARQNRVNADLFALVESLPQATVLHIYHELVMVVRNVPVLRYLIDCLQMQRGDHSISDDRRALTHRINVTLTIFELTTADSPAPDITTGDYTQLPWQLLTTPLLIFEQYLMNARFEALTHIVNGLRPLLNVAPTCSFCHDRRHLVHLDRSGGERSDDDDSSDIPQTTSRTAFNISSRTINDSVCDEFVLLHNDFAQRSEHTLATNCLDSLLRIYASKALDFRVTEALRRQQGASPNDTADIENNADGNDDENAQQHGSSLLDDPNSQHIIADGSLISTDSLAGCGSIAAVGTFRMSIEPTTRALWTRDEDATHCMCCRRAVFTMLTRRHHCRQCGRVVCHACSTRRELIPVLYSDVAVRVCDDCQRQLNADRQRNTASTVIATTSAMSASRSSGASPRPGLSRQATAHSMNAAAAVAAVPEIGVMGRGLDSGYWQFNGNQRHDELLRDEFCYEFAPSVSLCLSILALHSSTGPECAEFLLRHCGRFESLLRPLQPDYPNPEVDYALVTRMLHCLALAAKVRGGMPEDCDIVLEHADIIRAVVQHRCEALLPMEPLNRESFRKLRDALVLAEKWQLALEVSLKRGFATTGVMAAWGIACLKSGCFETAREKFAHCISRPPDATDDDVFKIFATISYETQFSIIVPTELPCIKRASKSPPLLAEIVSILENTCHPTQPDVLARATVIRNSNTSLMGSSSISTSTTNGTNTTGSSKQMRRIKTDSMPCHEPAMNILHKLANLKHIANGTYEYDSSNGSATNNNAVATNSYSSSSFINDMAMQSSLTSVNTVSSPAPTAPIVIDMKRLTPSSRFYDECLYYLTAYANHNDIVAFLVKHCQTRTALKYIHYQSVDVEHFVHTLFMPHIRRGQAAIIVQHMCEMDETLMIWRRYIIAVCGHLERSGMLNSMYLLQLLFRDPVRASMTCVRFYERGAINYMDLQAQAFHLVTAEQHLTKELDLCQWEEIRVVRNSSRDRTSNKAEKQNSNSLSPKMLRSRGSNVDDRNENRPVAMKWNSRTLNSHIGTIGRQLEVTKFLAACEQAGRPTTRLLPTICMQSTRLPTLFGSNKDRVQLAMLVLICGTNVTEGFGLAFRIIQDFRLDAEAVYTATAKYLAGEQRLTGVEQLLECIRGNVEGSAAAVGIEQRLCDRILSVTVDTICGLSTGGLVGDTRRRLLHGTSNHSVGSGLVAAGIFGGVAGRESFDRLVRQVADVSVRINCYIAGGQLKSAYLLAVQHDRVADIRKVMRHAEACNQTMLRRLCEKKLGLSE